jgi:RNA polymerase sigma factor (TIGR02999 family)
VLAGMHALLEHGSAMADRTTRSSGSSAHADAGKVERLLTRLGDGDENSRGELFALVYDQLKAMARARVSQQHPGHTLQPTALVNETFLRMCGPRAANWSSRGHFFAVAARAMRSVLVDHARRKKSDKRRPAGHRIDLDALLDRFERSADLLAFDEALVRLEQRDAGLGQLVELRFFSGLTMPECAVALGIAERSAFRWWETARAFLHRELVGE